ncbi:type I toxin-antitoxin system SymE family toxin [Fulvivirga sp. M361]|uniref:SymE family type I addiction module toxin n=1 Tax=Fulvivirga sp. M361 TaxID=2594266 RepID=UPI001179AA43|nr:SymE family type I addiction module toxin [Fulvivirga sp. M361]TRX61874.1 type I toxin-antitoxin system SymE family toxin [Fulvivirga sp. M361]
MNSFRKLKIHSKYRSRRWDHITVPEIRLEGKWLDALGFKEGCQIKIKSQKNRLIITLNIEDRE